MMMIKKDTIKDTVGGVMASVEASQKFWAALGTESNPVIRHILSFPEEKRSTIVYQLLDRNVSGCPEDQQVLFAATIDIIFQAAKRAMRGEYGPSYDDARVNCF